MAQIHLHGTLHLHGILIFSLLGESQTFIFLNLFFAEI
jgi:hypothetical protein